MNISPNNLNKLREVISAYHLRFLLYIIGANYFSDSETELLKSYFGENILKDFEGNIPLVDKIYMLGQLNAKIGNPNLLSLGYKDFLSYLNKNQHIDQKVTTSIDEEKLSPYKQQIYLDILGVGAKVEKELGQDLLNVVTKNKKDTIQNIAENLKDKFEDWNNMLDGSIAYNSHAIFEQGKADKFEEEEGEDQLVYKQPLPGACPHCIRLYLTEGEGSRPRIFKLRELIANGTNIGRKPSEWKATLGPIHVNCRCILFNIPKNYTWDSEKGTFVPMLSEGKHIERKSKVKVYVGSRVFEV